MEIADRKFRNHMRDNLVLFKGRPSTSPFCTWVNDPREPEELPPDWRPENPEWNRSRTTHPSKDS